MFNIFCELIRRSNMDATCIDYVFCRCEIFEKLIITNLSLNYVVKKFLVIDKIVTERKQITIRPIIENKINCFNR